MISIIFKFIDKYIIHKIYDYFTKKEDKEKNIYYYSDDEEEDYLTCSPYQYNYNDY